MEKLIAQPVHTSSQSPQRVSRVDPELRSIHQLPAEIGRPLETIGEKNTHAHTASYFTRDREFKGTLLARRRKERPPTMNRGDRELPCPQGHTVSFRTSGDHTQL